MYWGPLFGRLQISDLFNKKVGNLLDAVLKNPECNYFVVTLSGPISQVIPKEHW